MGNITDPATGTRYVYGRTIDGKYYQIAAIWDSDDGTYGRVLEGRAV